MSTEWGLSNSSVNSILQDEQGFMWFGTLNGLNKYDGFSFEVFKNTPHSSESISGNRITSLMLDSSGLLWVGTWNSGISVYDSGKNNFSHITCDPLKKNSVRSNKITSLVDDNGYVWVGTDGVGISKLDKRTKKIVLRFSTTGRGVLKSSQKKKIFFHSSTGEHASSLSDNRIRAMIIDKNDNVLWVGTASGGLNRINLKKNTIRTYRYEEGVPHSLSSDEIISLLLDSAGVLWIGTGGGGLNRYNKKTDNFLRIDSMALDSEPRIGRHILAMYRDSFGLLWIGTWEEGLVCYDYERNIIKKFRYNKSDWKSLSSNRVLAIFEDRSGLLWIGTHRGGFCIYDRLKSEFLMLNNNTCEEFNKRSGIIQTLIEDKEGCLWIGTDMGLEKVNSSTGEISGILDEAPGQRIYSQFDIKTLFEDRNGDILIGTKHNGLVTFQKATGKKSFIRHDPLNPGSLSCNHVSAIFRDKPGTLLIGTFGGGLDIFLEEKGEIKHNKHKPGSRFSLSNDYVTTILEDREGYLWVGTFGGGLNKFDRENGHFFSYKYQSGDAQSISSNIIHDISEDKKGNLWVGCSAGGLNKFDKKTGKFINYSDKAYLDEDEIFNVLVDDNGYIWLGTNKRLAKFDPESETFLYYDTYYWLNNNEIVSTAAFKSKSGELFFGGIKGISYFNPDKLSEINEPPILLISSVLLNDRTVSTLEYDPVNDQKVLRLPYYKNEIYFIFGIIDFRVPDNSRYSYKLEGNDETWESHSNLEYLFYDELSPGKYTFIVKGANHYGIWDNQGDSVRIIISTPFWGTLWFKVLAGLSFIGLILGLYRWRTYKISRQKSELEKKVEERTKALEVKQKELIKAREFLEVQVEERTKELRRKNLELENEIKERELTEAERRNLEKQLYESQKMESIGRLAGGIAHDFNNILAVIMGYTDLLKLKFSDTETKVGKAIHAILINSRRARDLVSQLLGFARGGKYHPIPISINRAIKQTISVSGKIFEKKTKIEYQFESKISSCLADKSQLDQVLANLVINASDAMPNGGKIIFKTENKYIDVKASKKYPDIKPGKYVKFSISDTGIGIPKKIINKIFEPFFTTKGKGEGTGLGLATVYGIIKNHQGHIEISSEPDKGTTLTILLPACEEKSIDKEEYSGILPGKEGILVVDDEKDVVTMINEQLSSLGYNVLMAEDGRRALQIYKKQKHRIDLVLLDMIMPDMTGKETFFELKKLNPLLKVFLMSGFSKGNEATDLLNNGAEDFIQKPISLPALSKKIYRVLNPH
jgi:signal transduction histidine kinase/ligand-binding sensor domain-containing protein